MIPSGSPPVRLLTTFEQVYPDNPSPQILLQAPERKMWAAAMLNGTAFCTIYSADANARTRFSSQSALHKRTVNRRALPRWAHYIGGVFVLIDVPNLAGIDAVFCGDEPLGPVYDYAQVMLFAALWYDLNQQPYTPQSLQDLAERVRREYIEAQ